MGREEERRRGERRRKREKKKKAERDPVKRLAASCGSVLTLQVERVGRPRGGFHQLCAGEREVIQRRGDHVRTRATLEQNKELKEQTPFFDLSSQEAF